MGSEMCIRDRAIFVWCKDTCHTGDFVYHFSASLFFCNYAKSGENVLKLKAETATPRNWQNHPFTLCVNLLYPLYDVAWMRHTSYKKKAIKNGRMIQNYDIFPQNEFDLWSQNDFVLQPLPLINKLSLIFDKREKR